jgi:hypothetical protein
LSRIRVDARSGVLWIGDTEELEDRWKRVAKPLVEQEISPGDLLTRCLITVLLGDAEVAAEEFQDGNVPVVRPGCPVRRAPRQDVSERAR